MISADKLEFEGEWSENFRHGVYTWIHVKRFRSSEPLTGRKALAKLLDHSEYRDDFVSGQNKGGPIHGPYWVDGITTGDFDEVSADQCAVILNAWRSGWSLSGDAAQRADLIFERVETLIRQAKQRWSLRNLRETAEHEWGWVIGLDGGFHEFVLIMPDGEIDLVVASDD